MDKIETYLIDEIKKILHLDNDKILDRIIKICEDYYNKPVNCITDLKKRNTKLKGDIFECLAKLYFLNVYGLSTVWYYKEIPQEIKQELKLTNNDMGIDLVGVDSNGHYIAIQAKYRKRNSLKKVSVTWKQLSTFYALCLKTGPYYSHIIFTTADYVTHIGKKTQKDKTITYNALSKLNKFNWICMCGSNGFTINDEGNNGPSGPSGYSSSSGYNSTSTFDINKLREIRISKFQ